FGLGGPDDGPTSPPMESWRDCYGKLEVLIPDPGPIRPMPQAYVVVITQKAHTGKRSLKVDRATRFEQDALLLVPGKRYLLTAWVSREETDVDSIVSRSGSPPGTYSPDIKIFDRPSNGEL